MTKGTKKWTAWLHSKHNSHRNGEDPTSDQARAWQSVTQVIDSIADADLMVISTPMWNFGVPFVLKHLIDIIAQPGYGHPSSPSSPWCWP
ncbi:NAD(P)H-dependent oxidoreductase [uncultured Roseobacter sp.]|uniref:NAD(P)H-dependent oxidoreductase n=1 Tax=uncultured Roseobacter sp. TaxID=114847 RepID=UPI002610D3BC|nr:NAD(P)H-dependent oxidoreductase [uncultured Roseobacter sp.]